MRERQVVVRVQGNEEIIMSVSDIGLIGEHNWENVCAAIMAAKTLGVDNPPIVAAVKSFSGLEHRLEFVADKQGVRYYNDSIATTPESTIAAIQAFEQPKIIILGGSSKQSDFASLAEVIRNSSSVKAIIGWGQEWPRIKQALGQTPIQLMENCQTMDAAMAEIKKLAVAGDVVLLSPACASFGMFKDYKDRGRQFKAAVERL